MLIIIIINNNAHKFKYEMMNDVHMIANCYSDDIWYIWISSRAQV